MKPYIPKEEIELWEIAKKIYNGLDTNMDTQKRLSNYLPKPFEEKKTYKQDWPLYEKAMSQEKLMFFRILKDAVEYLNLDYNYKGNGRPQMYCGDIIKALCIKSFSNYSSWRVESELKIAKAMGVLDEVPKRSTLNHYMKNPAITKYLDKLYKIIAEPLSELEIYFAADATGISNKYGNLRWRTIRHTSQEMKKVREYSKLHIISGCKTNVICSAKVTKGNAHESPYFKPLLDDTARIFNIKEVSADAGYLSRDNVKAIDKIGAVPFIAGKKNVNIPGKSGLRTPWNNMLRLWKRHQMFFAEHYHRRSNVESTFGSLKRKFGDFCRCKKESSQTNEILCKIVCYNASVLSEALLEYDLRRGFMASF